MKRRKMLLAIVLILSIIMQSILPLTMVNASTSVDITLNSNLYEAVKNSLIEQKITASYEDAKNVITISQDELDKVTYLNLSNSDIDDLTNLSQFTKLEELNLTANELTVNSHLDELSSLNLKKLNLSSNKLESIKSITNFKNIEHRDITNQEVNGKEIVAVDISDESDHIKTVKVQLPDILLEDTGLVDVEWITEEVDGTAAIDWTSFNPKEAELTLKIATGDGDNYNALKGLIKITVFVNDSSSKLANTRMNFYYAVVDSDETGIIFEDENLYKAIKSQLTQGQEENEELDSYGAEGETLYKKAYDEALILVIDSNTIINRIPSLILNDKKLTNLKGLEKFVGLETDLNLSYNYINSLETIIELEKNKETKEKEVQDKYSKFLAKLADIRTKVMDYKNQSESLAKQIKEKQEAIDKETDANKKKALVEEKAKLLSDKSEVDVKLANYSELETVALNKLYRIYEKEYRLTSLLPYEMNVISLKEIRETDLETAKAYAHSIMDKLVNLEETEALTAIEKNMILKMFDIKSTKTVPVLDENGQETGETKEETIEKPIKEYVDMQKEAADYKTISDYQSFIINAKYLDVACIAYNYCLILKMNNSSVTECQMTIALNEMRQYYLSIGLDSTFVDAIINKADTLPEGFVDNILNGFICATEAYTTNYATERALAGKLVAATGDVSKYVTLPRIQRLNICDNKLASLEGIEIFTELKALNAYKNILGKVDNVDWKVLADLEELNLGYNQLSDISPLTVLTKIKVLNVSRNLLKGNFDFYLADKKDLVVADFSHNQYENISYFLTQFAFQAKAAGMKVEDYLASTYAPKVSFKYQSLEMSATVVKKGDFVTIELPAIFAQFEKIDYARTSFGETSQNGTVLADGTGVVLRTPDLGKYRGVVTVDGQNGNSFTTDGIGYGTTCVIDYDVVNELPPEDPDKPVDPEDPDKPVEPEDPDKPVDPEDPDKPVDPEDPDKPVDPEDPDKPVDPEDPNKPAKPEYGYTVEDGYVYVLTPETSLADFAKRLISLEDYKVTVKQNGSQNIVTGSVVMIETADGKEVDILEVVVKGDVNGDGEIDARDSGIIRNVINDTTELVGVYDSAADVNSDGEVDSLDALLVLQYRADKISSFEK